MQPIHESPEETSLRQVAQRIAIRIRPDVEPKADSGGGSAPLVNTHAAQFRAFDPPELASRDADRRPCRVLAHAGIAPSEPDLAADLMVELPELLKGSIQPAISARHVAIVDARSPADYLGIACTLRLAPPAHRVNRRSKDRTGRRQGRQRRLWTTPDPVIGSGSGSALR